MRVTILSYLGRSTFLDFVDLDIFCRAAQKNLMTTTYFEAEADNAARIAKTFETVSNACRLSDPRDVSLR